MGQRKGQESERSSGTLYVVSTPIGNLEDITLRALRILQEANLIACEDTRVTKKLLTHHQIKTPMQSCHAHSTEKTYEALLRRLEAKEVIALCTDAGTPLLSDPGRLLVDAALEAGVAVVPIPGPSAVLAALVGAGLPTQRVLFLGFLPRDAQDVREILSPLRAAPYTLVLYESAQRLGKTLVALEQSLGDRSAAICRELTKRFETFDRGLLSELKERYATPPLGEIVIVVAGTQNEERDSKEAILADARRLLRGGERPAEAAKVLAGAHGLAKKEAYQIVLAAKASE